MNVRPKAIDLFAGAGGLSLGFEQAGFDVVAAVEIDPVHAAVHKYNFPDCVVIPKSVEHVTGGAIRDAAGLGAKTEVDVVVGGAPCQGFSLIGLRALEDPRNHLVKEFLRIVSEVQPRYFVFENVKGLTIGRHKKFLSELIEASRACGYRILEPWRVLNAYDYGVPQNRERLFLLGARGDQSLPGYPPKTKVRYSCAEAIDDIPNADSFEVLLQSDSVRTTKWGVPSQFASEMRCQMECHWHFGYKRHWDPSVLTGSMRTVHTEESTRRFFDTQPGCVEAISRFFKLPPHGPSNTLRAGTDSARGAFTSPRPIHYRYGRCVTVREMARLHGYPDWFRFHETKWHGARQVGNSVPPPLARAVASQVMEALGCTPVPPECVLVRKYEWLLSMNITEASRYFGIRNPIAGRERKHARSKHADSVSLEGIDV